MSCDVYQSGYYFTLSGLKTRLASWQTHLFGTWELPGRVVIRNGHGKEKGGRNYLQDSSSVVSHWSKFTPVKSWLSYNFRLSFSPWCFLKKLCRKVHLSLKEKERPNTSRVLWEEATRKSEMSKCLTQWVNICRALKRVYNDGK